MKRPFEKKTPGYFRTFQGERGRKERGRSRTLDGEKGIHIAAWRCLKIRKGKNRGKAAVPSSVHAQR